MKKIETVFIMMVLVLGTFASSNLAFAQETTQISMRPFGSTEIDLSAHEGKRIIYSWVNVSNFDLNDGYFLMDIVSESGEVIYTSEIQVRSTATGLVSFTSLVIFVGIDELVKGEILVPGEYQMQMKTISGTGVDSITFSVTE